MKRTFIAAAVLALCAAVAPVRARTKDVAFAFRMGAGFPGDVNRTGMMAIMPGQMNSTSPVLLYGNPTLVDTATNTIRGFLSSDTGVTAIGGVLVRPYPTQQSSGGMSSSIGAAVPPTSGVCDVLASGHALVTCNNFAAAPPTKGGAVFVWVVATSGVHIQGGFESAASGVNTVAITNARYNGPPDASGVCELQVWSA